MDDLLKLYIDLNTLCQLQEVAKSNTEARVKDILQSYSTLKTEVNPDTDEHFSAIAHIIRQIAKSPNTTFKQFLDRIVDGGDSSKLIESVNKK